MSVQRFGQGWGLAILFTMTATGCSMVDGRESGKYDDGARYHMKLTKALVAPTWYEEGVYDEHQRGFINLVQQMRMRGYPVTEADLESQTQVLSYDSSGSTGKISQRPIDSKAQGFGMRLIDAQLTNDGSRLTLWFSHDVEIRGRLPVHQLLTLVDNKGVPICPNHYIDEKSEPTVANNAVSFPVTRASPDGYIKLEELRVIPNTYAIVMMPRGSSYREAPVPVARADGP